MRARTAIVFSALALASATFGTGTALADSPCAGGDAMPGSVADSVIQQATLCLLNQQRAAVGEVALVEQPQLDVASTGFSQEMVAQQFFAHVAPDGSTMSSRIAATGYLSNYGAWILGENIAWGSGSLATPNQIVIAWMNSEEHRDNILDARFREIGLGIATGAPVATSAPGATYTTDFGTRSAPRAGTSTTGAAGSGTGTTGTTPGSGASGTTGTSGTTAGTGAAATPSTSTSTKPRASPKPATGTSKKKAAAKKAAKAKAARRARAARRAAAARARAARAAAARAGRKA